MLKGPNGRVNISDITSFTTDKTASSHASGESLMDGICMVSMKLDSDTKESVEALTSEGMTDFEKNKLVSKLRDFTGGEVFEFSTCNRVLYVGFGVSAEELILAIEEVIGVFAAPFRKSDGMAVWRDLVRICSGLDSFIVGELQVMGQFRDAVSWHKQNNHVSSVNCALFDHVIAANRIVRKEMGFDKTAESMLNLATNAMAEMIDGNKQLNNLVLGFGEMGSKAVESLIQQNQKSITVISRDPEISSSRYPYLSERCDIMTLKQWVETGGEADLVISTLRNKKPTFTLNNPFPSNNSITVMDFSWPSSFAPDSVHPEGTIYDMEHWIRRSRKLGVDWNYEETLEKGEGVIASVEDNFQMALKNLSQANFRSFVYAKMEEKSQIWESSSSILSSERAQIKAFCREIAGWICQTNGEFNLSDLNDFVTGTTRNLSDDLLKKLANDVNETILSMEGTPSWGA